nr:MAG TPA: Epidermal growth factor receptor [Caudoviricetes sp.]
MNKEELLKCGAIIFGIIICFIGGVFIFSFLCSFIYYLYNLIRYKKKKPIISNALKIFNIMMVTISESSVPIHFNSDHSSSSGFGGGSSRGGGAGHSF